MVRHKNIALAFFVLFLCSRATLAQEIEFRVLGVQGRAILSQRVQFSTGSVGDLSHEVLEKALSQGLLRQYQGSEAGVSTIDGLGSALEVLSNTQMNAYGWCYRVDGQSSDLLAHQHNLSGNETRIEWFYAYAHLDKDEWKSMCVPAGHEVLRGPGAGKAQPEDGN
jgi:hypothetical protein